MRLAHAMIGTFSYMKYSYHGDFMIPTVSDNKNGDEVAAEAEKPQWDRKYPPEAQLLLGRPQKYEI